MELSSGEPANEFLLKKICNKLSFWKLRTNFSHQFILYKRMYLENVSNILLQITPGRACICTFMHAPGQEKQLLKFLIYQDNYDKTRI